MPENLKKAALFTALACALAWGLVGAFTALGGKWNTAYAVPVAVGMMYAPLLAVLVLQKLVYREPFWKDIGVSFKLNRWFVVAWLVMPALAAAAFGLSLLIPGVEYSGEMEGFYERLASVAPPERIEEAREFAERLPVHPFWLGLLQGLVAAVTVNALAAFGEEAGWRGFLLKRLALLGFWKSALVIGAIWGVWHFPVILLGHNYPQHPLAGVFMMIVFCMLLAPLHSYVRLKARSVIAAGVLHGGLNASAGLAIMLVKGGSDLTTGLTGLPGLIVLALANLSLFVFDRFVTKEPVAELLEEMAHERGAASDRDDDMLDLVNERGETVGAVRRGDCHGNPALAHRAVHVFVKNSRGDLFLQKRARYKTIEPGKWDTSVGGHLAPGESYREGALRELEEEIGLDLGDASRLEHCHDYVWRSDTETEHVRTFMLERDGPFELNPDEIEDGRFWGEDELREAVGTRVLTPNLEEELCQLGISRV